MSLLDPHGLRQYLLGQVEHLNQSLVHVRHCLVNVSEPSYHLIDSCAFRSTNHVITRVPLPKGCHCVRMPDYNN